MSNHADTIRQVKQALDTWGAGGTLREWVDAHLDALLAENESLCASVEGLGRNLNLVLAERDEAVAENKRLRKALETIVTCRAIARETLAGEDT
jgi:hypothetical protein